MTESELLVLLPLGNGIWQVVAPLAFQRGALVVQAVAVGLQVVEPDPLGGAAFSKEQDGGADTGVGLEHAAGEADDAFELVVFDELLA